MWLKEAEFRLLMGGNVFVNMRSVFDYEGEPLFTIHRREDDGQLSIDFDVFDEAGKRVASVRRNNIHVGDGSVYEVTRDSERITLDNKQTGARIVEIIKLSTKPTELEVYVKTFLPNGYLLECSPSSFNIDGNGSPVKRGIQLTNNVFVGGCAISIAKDGSIGVGSR